MQQMQETHDEGNENTGPAAEAGTERLGKDTHRIEFRMHGTEGAFARARLPGNIIRNEITQHAKGYIHWAKYSFSALVFSQMTACMVLQGVDLRNVFTSRAYAVRQRNDVDEEILDYGPFYLLKGALSPVYEPPLRLKDVVLARLVTRPQDLTDLEIVTHLIMNVCPP